MREVEGNAGVIVPGGARYVSVRSTRYDTDASIMIVTNSGVTLLDGGEWYSR